jgi:hypothetical protein
MCSFIEQNSKGGFKMKKIAGLFLLTMLFASSSMAEKVDGRGRPCGSIKGIANCMSGCWEDGVRVLTGCSNSLKVPRQVIHDDAGPDRSDRSRVRILSE